MPEYRSQEQRRLTVTSQFQCISASLASAKCMSEERFSVPYGNGRQVVERRRSHTDLPMQRIPDATEKPTSERLVSQLNRSEVLHTEEQSHLPELATLPSQVRRLFAALGAFTGPDFGYQAGLALAEALALTKSKEALQRLMSKAILQYHVDEAMPIGSDRTRLRFHEELRTVATARFMRWQREDRINVYRAIAHYYVQYVSVNGNEALLADEVNICRAIEWAQEQQDCEMVVLLCRGMQYFWRDNAHTSEGLHYLPMALAAAELVGATSGGNCDKVYVPHMRLVYGQMLYQAGCLHEAELTLKQGLELSRELMDWPCMGEILSLLADVAVVCERLQEAEQYCQEALAIAHELQDRQSEGEVLTILGEITRKCGRYEEAEAYLENALVHMRERQHWPGIRLVLSLLADVAVVCERLQEAEQYCQEALAIAHELQDRQSEGEVLTILGEITRKCGRYEEAEVYLNQSLGIFRGVEDRIAELGVLYSLGVIAVGCGHMEKAEHYYRQSLEVAHIGPYREGSAIIHCSFPCCFKATGPE